MEVKANTLIFLCYSEKLPPTVNSNYRFTGKRMYKKTNSWTETFQWLVKQKYQVPIFVEDNLHVLFFWGKDRADVDNRLKSALDAMNQIIYEDDAKIKSLTSIKLGGNRSFLCCVSPLMLEDLIIAANSFSSCIEAKEVIERNYSL